MTSNRPYLIRAIYEWIVDNGMTPHLLVNATLNGVVVPTQYVEEGRIVLNVGPTAVKGLELGNDWISFNARFRGTAMDVFVPPVAVLGVYARENGQGMLFPDEDGVAEAPPDHEPEPPTPPPPRPVRKERPKLKVVK
jgi:stringent starvation protein B